ncbi:hypothetical protein SCWH03_46230 [Streptomyces pacificus]|uniref:Uncharacterized protein n=1 Tax=Streptomyces pacificus TaxID=2705029 RepID=A0A6A0B195_9ACTN|nr:hypothetical protein SCWH03_46230 [Streptomyces pacificus]
MTAGTRSWYAATPDCSRSAAAPDGFRSPCEAAGVPAVAIRTDGGGEPVAGHLRGSAPVIVSFGRVGIGAAVPWIMRRVWRWTEMRTFR